MLTLEGEDFFKKTQINSQLLWEEKEQTVCVSHGSRRWAGVNNINFNQSVEKGKAQKWEIDPKIRREEGVGWCRRTEENKVS